MEYSQLLKFFKKSDILLIKFETMRQVPEETVIEVLKFLNAPINLERVKSAIQNNSINRMRDKESRARNTVFRAWQENIHFIRRGTSGGWRETLTDKQLQLVEAQSAEAMVRLGYKPISSINAERWDVK